MRTISKNIGQLGYDEEVRNSLNDAAIELPLVNSGFTFKGDHDPTISEYPSTPTIGDVWVIVGVTGSYTFTAGDLIGRDVVNGNQIVYGTSWSILNYNEISLSEYNSNKALWQNQAVTHNITVDADYTLTTTQNTYGRIIITDTGALLTGATNIIVNTIERSFIAQNDTAQTLTFKTSAGTGVAIAAGKSASVLCDATNVIIVDSNYAYSKSESDAAILADALERRKLYAKETTTHEITSDLDYTLTSAQNLYGRIVITDTVVTLTGAINIIVDTTEREFIAVNSTAQILTFKTSAGTGIAVGVGKVAILQCDGTNVIVNDTNYSYSKTEITNIINAIPRGRKNLLINGRGTHQQRGVTGGIKQVVLNTRNLGGSHTISWTGTATVTIKEATTLAASDALTTWDAALVTGASSGTTITLTAGKYVHVEFSTTDWDFALLEYGSVATNYPILEDTLSECLPYFEAIPLVSGNYLCISQATSTTATVGVLTYSKKLFPPLISTSNDALFLPLTASATDAGGSISFAQINENMARVNTTGSTGLVAGNASGVFVNGTATIYINGEIFKSDDGVGIQYCEDRWYKDLP